jgi:high-affinity iron transporter
VLQSLIIVSREGFEAFLIVAITLAYLRKSGQAHLIRAVHWAIAASVVASGALAYVLYQGVNEALWEAVLGAVTVVMVATLVIHMWRMAPRLKREMEQRLEQVTTRRSNWMAFAGVFLFTLLMISREGMETALMLYQIRGGFLTGALLGLAAAVALSWLWARVGHRVPLKRFFQVTSIYLLLFMLQVGVYTFHEFAEAGVLPNSDALHEATEILSPYGLYGKWFSVMIILACATWLAIAWIIDSRRPAPVGAGLLRFRESDGLHRSPEIGQAARQQRVR